MASITIKNVPTSFRRALKRRAKKNGRSLSSELLALLENEVLANAIRAEALTSEARRFRDSLNFTTTPAEIDAAKRAGRE